MSSGGAGLPLYHPREIMKLLRRISILILSAPALALAALAQDWTAPLASELQKLSQPEINAVHFFNRHVGWAVGGHARDKSTGNSVTLMFRTSDGGETWERLTLFDGQQHIPGFVDIGFADANNGWLLTSQDVVLRTKDGGDVWEAVQPLPWGWGDTFLILGPDAVMVGGSMANGRQINVTTDGGRSWRNATVRDDGNTGVTDLAFVAPGSFFAVTASPYTYGGIHRSDDGGRTWRTVVEGDKALHAIAFSESGRNGVAAGENVAYTTRDGGNTWQRVMAAGTRYTANFLDENTIAAFGSGPSMLISGDGGKSWQPGGGPGLSKGRLVDAQFVDPGWWYIAGGYGANELYRYVDPDYADPIARGTLPLPKPIETPNGTVLPPGTYEVQLLHRGLDHALGLRLLDPAEGVEIGVRDPGDDPQTNQFACDPCEAEIPVSAEYDTQELKEGQDDRSIFKLALEPTTTGVAIVMDAAAKMSHDLSIALAALGVSENAEIDPRSAPEKKKGRSMLGRLKKAASGDIAGAIEGAANPKESAERVQVAMSAPPEIYRVRIRYPINIFGGADEEQ